LNIIARNQKKPTCEPSVENVNRNHNRFEAKQIIHTGNSMSEQRISSENFTSTAFSVLQKVLVEQAEFQFPSK
jgi:hypothetical protein